MNLYGYKKFVFHNVYDVIDDLVKENKKVFALLPRQTQKSSYIIKLVLENMYKYHRIVITSHNSRASYQLFEIIQEALKCNFLTQYYEITTGLGLRIKIDLGCTIVFNNNDDDMVIKNSYKSETLYLFDEFLFNNNTKSIIKKISSYEKIHNDDIEIIALSTPIKKDNFYDALINKELFPDYKVIRNSDSSLKFFEIF